MQKDRVEPFADNWSYLKAELTWLDRVLMAAVARQRKEMREVERVAQNRADRVTSHWWKGIILLDGEGGYDETPAPRPAPTEPHTVRSGYQQQLQQRIQASQQQGIGLGLPLLCDRLRLSLFEKNLVLLSLAPEVNRRYGRIYSYLQSDPSLEGRADRRGSEVAPQRQEMELPTVDLALRILCRNDGEWRTARKRLTCPSPLIQHHLLKLSSTQEATLLTRRLQLADSLTNYLLADQPGREMLEALFQPIPRPKLPPSSPPIASHIAERPSTTHWPDLILPIPLLEDLHHLCDRVRFREQIETIWHLPSQPGTLALLQGPAGTGKTTAAHAIAQELQTPLTWVDLGQILEAEYATVLQELTARSPQVLFLRSAQIWFGRSNSLPTATLQHFLEQRRQTQGLTLLSVREGPAIQYHWRQCLDAVLEFPMPNGTARVQLWKRAVAPLPVAPRLPWKTLAQWPLTGGDIQAIVHDAAVYAAASSEQKLQSAHLTQALQKWRKKFPK